MNNTQGSTSPQEKEKLRKKLQKLFKNQDQFGEFATGKSNKKSQHHQLPKNQKVEGQKMQQAKENVKQNKSMFENPKQNPAQKQKPAKFSKVSQQNGSVKAPKKEIMNDKPQGFAEDQAKKGTKVAQNSNSFSSTSQSKPLKTKSSESHKSNKNEEILQQKKNKAFGKSKNQPQKKSAKAPLNKEQPGNQPKSVKPSGINRNNAAVNGHTKLSKNQMKRAKKRAASVAALNNENKKSNKKPKLNHMPNKINARATESNHKLNEINDDSSLSSLSSQDENEFDVKDMSGYVRGGDFNSDNEESDMEYKYWREYYSSEDTDDKYASSDDMSSGNVEKSHGSQLKQFNRNETFGSEEEYYDEEDDEDEFESYYSSEDDENERYSDFDENDYEEDEDSYEYSMDDDCSSNYDDYNEDEYDNNESYDFNEDDDHEYKLPEHVPEDLIIHAGTATKFDLKPEDNVTFDSDNEEAQIIEIKEEKAVKIILQPKAYEKEELLKLKYEEKVPKPITIHKKEEMCNDDDCPKLVPIVDEDGFQLYNPDEESEEDGYEEEMDSENESMEEYEHDDMDEDDVSLGSEYTEVNSDDADSLMSEDINEKYLNKGHNDSDSDQSIDENMWQQKHKVDVIDATQYQCESNPDNMSDTNTSLNDDIKQIPSLKLFENVDLKTGSSISSTTIIDNEIFKTKIDKEISTKSEGKQEVPVLEAQEKTDLELSSDDNVERSSVEETQVTAKATKHYVQNLVDYNTKFFNALDSNLVLVYLKDPFYIYGTVRLTLLAGTVEVYGHNLELNKEVEMFSPRGCSVIEISPSKEKSTSLKSEIKKALKHLEPHFALNDLKTISELYNNEMDAVVLLKRNENRKKIVQQFKKFMNENVFPNINNINSDRPLYNSEYLLRCIINTSNKEQKCLRLPQQWQQLGVTCSSRILLAGGKSVGKSTLLRYLINRHLPQEILLIDLDIGQPEVFVPQTVSCTIVRRPLLGPGFMLNLQPEISYAVGHTNIALCVHKYMEAVRSLITYCKSKKEYQDMPWLINTMGYNKGFGLELMSAIVQELPLTDLIQLQSSKEINNFDGILYPHVLRNVPSVILSEMGSSREEEVNINEKSNDYRLHVWKSAVKQGSRFQKDWEMSAKDMRFAILLARLSEALQGHAEWLADVKPLSASLNDLKIINLMDNAATASKEELTKAVEANLVYLCHYEEKNKPLRCQGIGVLRAIDYHIHQVYLIPAVPYNLLKAVNCLAIGEMPLPTSLFTNQGSIVKNAAPFVYNTVAANASKAIKQIYHRQPKFLTGKHKSLE